MTSKNRRWSKRLVKENAGRPGRKYGATEASTRRRGGPRLLLEELEPRLAPAILTYNWNILADPDPLDGADVTLKVAQHDGANWLQIVDNESGGSVLTEDVLDEDFVVTVAGGLLGDQLTVDFSFVGVAPPHNISVGFDGAGPDILGIDDQVTIAGAAPLYQPQSFQLTANDDIRVAGAFAAVGDISLTSTETTTSGLLGTSILA